MGEGEREEEGRWSWFFVIDFLLFFLFIFLVDLSSVVVDFTHFQKKKDTPEQQKQVQGR